MSPPLQHARSAIDTFHKVFAEVGSEPSPAAIIALIRCTKDITIHLADAIERLEAREGED